MGLRGHAFRLMWTTCAATLVLIGALVQTSRALAATRYAAPSAQGSGNCSSPANACTLATAVSGSAQGDTVIVAGNQGPYGTSSSPLTSTIQGSGTGDAPGAIEGAPGQPRPVIYTNADPGVNLNNEALVAGKEQATSVSNLDIEELASSLPTALYVEGNVDHVIVRSLNTAYDACAAGGLPTPATEVISDSLCVAGGANSSALGISSNGTGQPVSVTLRNDTAYATGSGSSGISYSIGGYTFGVSATNVIARGAQADVSVNEYSGGHLSVTLDHSNYANVSQGGGATATPAAAGSNQTAFPKFVAAAGGDFHEAVGSPTIDAGTTSAANGATDLDGNPRTIGGATDIGAYEASETPTLTPEAPTGIGAHQATLNASVDPNFSATNVQAFVGTSTSTEHPLPTQSAGAGLAPIALAFTASLLQPGVVYHYHFVATNAVGTSSTGDRTFKTPAIIFVPLPKLTGLSESHRVWREGSRLASVSRKRRIPVGTKFSFSLDQPAQVRLLFVESLGGRRVKGHCVGPRPSNRLRPRCTRTILRGTLSVPGHTGKNTVSFQGRVSRTRKLPPGSYAVTVIAVNSATQSSLPRTLRFTIVR